MDYIYGNAVAMDGGEIRLDLSIDGGEIGVFYDTGRGGVPFDGPYRVVPKFHDIALPTAHKLMKQDVLFEAIPVLEVSNPQGGLTVTIGG